MKIIEDKVTLNELEKMSQAMFGNLVKAVVDIEKEIMAVDAELHADEEALLLEKGSKQENLWGINIYPEAGKEKFIEYTSLINIRPSQSNASMDIKSNDLRVKIQKIVNSLII